MSNTPEDRQEREADEAARAMAEYLDSQTPSSDTVAGPKKPTASAEVTASTPKGRKGLATAMRAAAKPSTRRATGGTSNVVLNEFENSSQGLIWTSTDKTRAPVHVCGPLDVIARTRDEQGENWGVLLTWSDPDGRQHEWAMPRSLLATDGREVRANLLDRGLYVSPMEGARKALMAYLSAFDPDASALCVSRGGWHGVGDRSVFVLPDEVFGAPPEERVVLQTTHAIQHAFRTAGTIAEWKAQVARLAAGNSRLALAIAAAFAAPLVELAGEESGGINFQGGSRLGKSTALRVAGSVWGGGGVSGYIRQWRGTANGLEGARAIRDEKLDLPEAANGRLKALGQVYAWAMEEELATEDPTANVGYLQGKHGGFHTWTVEEVRQFEKRWPIGTRPRLALAVLLFTGTRRSDAVRLGKQFENEGMLRFTEVKGSTSRALSRKKRRPAPKKRIIPILPQLREVVDASPTGDMVYIVSARGTPYKAASFGNVMRDWCNEAGLPHCSAHGLRKAGATIAANNGATAHTLMAIYGWETLKQAELYTREANMALLAKEGMHLVVPREKNKQSA